MKWNKQQAQYPFYQRSRKGTSRTHESYFIRRAGILGSEKWLAGFRYYTGNYVMVKEKDYFDTPEEARAYCEKRDKQKWRCSYCKKEMKVGMWGNHACEIEMRGE